MPDWTIEMPRRIDVCEHGSLRRACPNCELIELQAGYKRLREIVERVTRLPFRHSRKELDQLVGEARAALAQGGDHR